MGVPFKRTFAQRLTSFGGVTLKKTTGLGAWLHSVFKAITPEQVLAVWHVTVIYNRHYPQVLRPNFFTVQLTGIQCAPHSLLLPSGIPNGPGIRHGIYHPFSIHSPSSSLDHRNNLEHPSSWKCFQCLCCGLRVSLPGRLAGENHQGLSKARLALGSRLRIAKQRAFESSLGRQLPVELSSGAEERCNPLHMGC
jgi:hypothetical protein